MGWQDEGGGPIIGQTSPQALAASQLGICMHQSQAFHVT
jgi:hypothetical protein